MKAPVPGEHENLTRFFDDNDFVTVIADAKMMCKLGSP